MELGQFEKFTFFSPYPRLKANPISSVPPPPPTALPAALRVMAATKTATATVAEAVTKTTAAAAAAAVTVTAVDTYNTQQSTKSGRLVLILAGAVCVVWDFFWYKSTHA